MSEASATAGNEDRMPSLKETVAVLPVDE